MFRDLLTGSLLSESPLKESNNVNMRCLEEEGAAIQMLQSQSTGKNFKANVNNISKEIAANLDVKKSPVLNQLPI